MSEKKEWKYPEGTVRIWSGGVKVIKTHDNGPMDSIISPWMNYPSVPKEFEDKFRDCDALGRKIFPYKEPIEGELWLDKEFEDFTTSSGKKFVAADFKKYSKYQKGTYGYDFFSELSKRYLGDKIAFNAKLALELEEENEEKRARLRIEGKDANGVVLLSKEEINNIKSRLRSDFKYDESDKLTLKDLDEIHGKLQEVASYLAQGEDFTGEEGIVYGKAKSFLNELRNMKYKDVNLVKSDVRDILSLMNTTFKKNWGIRESYRKKLLNAMNYYIDKYKDDIEETEFENFNRLVGVDLYSPTREFYQKLKESPLFTRLDVLDTSYIGKFIQSPNHYDSKYDDFVLDKVSLSSIDEESGDKFYDVWYTNPLTEKQNVKSGVKELELQSYIRAKQSGVSSLDIPMKLRFKKLYDKELDGEWEEPDLTLLEVFEKLTNFLPAGHILTNGFLRKIRKENSLSNSDNSYAHFSPTNNEIFLSSQCLSEQQFGITNLDSGAEIVSVLTHEVGHSVSQKLYRRSSLLYRKFVRECGWSWEQFQGEARELAIGTGGGNGPARYGPARYGSKSDVPLISEYAGRSPEEAFAEYYSFYTQYKSRIDSYLKGDESMLKKDEGFNLVNTDKSYGDFSKEKRLKRLGYDTGLEDLLQTHQQIEQELKNANRGSEHIKIDVIDPYKPELATMREEDTNKNQIIVEKKPSSYSSNPIKPNPVFTVFDYNTGKHDIIKTDELKDAQVHYANKYLRRLTPTFSISKECCQLLQNKGFSINQIRDYTLSKVADKQIPQVKESTDDINSTYRGLKYRGEVVPVSKLTKMHGIFSYMKEIWESDELKKALLELGLSVEDEKIEDMNNTQKTDISSLAQIFSQAKQYVSNIVKSKSVNKQRYSDVVLRNYDGEVLLLQRSYQDTFMPGKWCLPGGKVEEGESFENGAIRELEEETGLKLPVKFVKEVEKEDCIIQYFEAFLIKPFASVLDNEEHYRTQFSPIERLDQYEMIFDLDKTIKELPLSIIDVVVDDMNDSDFITNLLSKKKEVQKSFDDNEIEVEEYVQLMGDIKLQSFNYIKNAFDKGYVTEENYLEAKRNLVKSR